MSVALRDWWQRHGLTALLAGLAMLALAAIGVETDWGRAVRTPLPDARAVGGANELAATLPPFALGELDVAFKESGERPLFTPSRRPPLPTQAAAAPQMKRGQFKLAGTVVNAGMSVAYLVEIAGNRTHRVNQGSEVLGQPGLVVDSVEPNRVVLKLGDETETLELRTAPSPPKPAAPVAGQAGAAPAGASANPPAAAPIASVPPAAAPGARPAAPVPAAPIPNPAAQAPVPGMSVLPGFVAGAPGAMPAPAAEVQSTESPAGQRRRRFAPGTPGAPQ
jgi:hypothetical protein